MTKNSTDNQLPDFLDKLEKTSEEAQKIPEVFAGNSIEVEPEEIVNLRPKFEQLINETELKSLSILRGALRIFRENFNVFTKANLFLTVGFMLLLFAVFMLFGGNVYAYATQLFNKIPLLGSLGLKSALPVLLILIFWIFFVWMRATYLAIVGNYFCPNEEFQPIRFGFFNIVSFILIECLQIIMFLIGIFLIVMSPVFGAKYFLALPVKTSQNDGAVNSMFESREYVRGHLKSTLRAMFFISTLSILFIGFFAVISAYFVTSNLVFWSLNFFLLIFFLLPLHTCYRFLLYKKLQNLTGALKFQTSFGERMWFIFSRLAFLGLVVVNIFLIVTGGFGDALDKIIFLASQKFSNF